MSEIESRDIRVLSLKIIIAIFDFYAPGEPLWERAL